MITPQLKITDWGFPRNPRGCPAVLGMVEYWLMD